MKKKNILDFRLNMLNILSVLLCVRNRTMWHEIEPDMKTARKSFHCAFYCAKQKFQLKKKYLLYMGLEPRTFTLSFLRSTDSPMADEIHYMSFIYVNIVNLRESRFTQFIETCRLCAGCWRFFIYTASSHFNLFMHIGQHQVNIWPQYLRDNAAHFSKETNVVLRCC